MLVSLIDRLAEKPSNVLRNAQNKYVRENPISMEEINTEIMLFRIVLRKGDLYANINSNKDS